MNTWGEVAECIRNVGWTRKEFWDAGTGAVCLLGACGLAWHDDPEYFGQLTDPRYVAIANISDEDADRIRELGKVILEQGDLNRLRLEYLVDKITQFNDYEATTEQDVLDVLDRLEQDNVG